MSGVLDRLLNLHPAVVCIAVGLLVFAEDAIFVGFVIPGETAAVLGGVAASQDRLPGWVLCVIVVAAAIIGDTVGYEVGKHVGPRILDLPMLAKRRERLDEAKEYLRHRGGWAVFLGRFTAFFRAVMPGLAGVSRMRYPVFLLFNATGGIVWGIGFVLLGYLAGNSYHKIESVAGRGSTIAMVVILLAVLVVWRLRAHRAKRAAAVEPQ